MPENVTSTSGSAVQQSAPVEALLDALARELAQAPNVRHGALRLLAALGESGDARAAPALRAIVTDGMAGKFGLDTHLPESALAAFSRIEGGRAFAPLLEILHLPTFSAELFGVKRAVADELARLVREHGTGIDDNVLQRVWEVRDPEAFVPERQFWERDPDPSVEHASTWVTIPAHMERICLASLRQGAEEARRQHAQHAEQLRQRQLAEAAELVDRFARDVVASDLVWAIRTPGGFMRQDGSAIEVYPYFCEGRIEGSFARQSAEGVLLVWSDMAAAQAALRQLGDGELVTLQLIDFMRLNDLRWMFLEESCALGPNWPPSPLKGPYIQFRNLVDWLAFRAPTRMDELRDRLWEEYYKE